MYERAEGIPEKRLGQFLDDALDRKIRPSDDAKGNASDPSCLHEPHIEGCAPILSQRLHSGRF